MAAFQRPRDGSVDGLAANSPTSSTKRKRSGDAGWNRGEREQGWMRETAEHDAARFVGSSSGIHFIRAVYDRLSTKAATRASSSRAWGDLVPGEDDQLRRPPSRDSLWRDDEVSHESSPENNTPSFDQLMEWSKPYFESWHPALPFLQGSTVLKIFEHAGTGGVGALNSLDYTILRSVLSISLADARQGVPLQGKLPSSMVFCSVDEALSSSNFALSQPASVRATQAALGIQTFLTSILCLNSASRLGGLIVRMAYHLGLHRCPARFPFFTAAEASIRRRVFWCIYCLERLLCQSLGLPLDIRDDDIDVCYPGEERHDSSAKEADEAHNLRLLTFLAKHASIRGLIVELRNKSLQSRQDTSERAIFVQASLAKWSNEIQELVGGTEEFGENSNQEAPISASHRLLLLILKNESIICLNRPVMSSLPSSSSYAAALQACVSAAKSICIAAKKYQQRHQRRECANTQGGDHRLAMPLLWPSFTWVFWISAFVLFHAAFEKQMRLDIALRHVQTCRDALTNIALRDTSWPEYCIGAIDELISAMQEVSGFLNPDGSFFAHMPRGATGGEGPTIPTSSCVTVSADRPSIQQTPSSFGFEPSTTEPLNDGHIPGQQVEIDGRYAPDPSPLDGVPHQMPAVSMTGLVPPATDPPMLDHESMMWYEQMFAGTLSVIDNPSLAGSGADAYLNPMWLYLR